MLLNVGSLVKNNTNTRRMIGNFSFCSIPQVIPTIMASVTEDVLKIQHRIWSSTVSLWRLIATWLRIFNDAEPWFNSHELVTVNFFFFEINANFHILFFIICYNSRWVALRYQIIVHPCLNYVCLNRLRTALLNVLSCWDPRCKEHLHNLLVLSYIRFEFLQWDLTVSIYIASSKDRFTLFLNLSDFWHRRLLNLCDASHYISHQDCEFILAQGLWFVEVVQSEDKLSLLVNGAFCK